MSDDSSTALDIVLAGRRVARFIGDTDEAAFLVDEQKHWAVVSQFLLIGEAVRRLSDEFKESRPNVPWKLIAGMRNRLIHEYDKIDWRLVWRTAAEDLPSLVGELEQLFDSDGASL